MSNTCWCCGQNKDAVEDKHEKSGHNINHEYRVELLDGFDCCEDCRDDILEDILS